MVGFIEPPLAANMVRTQYQVEPATWKRLGVHILYGAACSEWHIHQYGS